MFRFMFVLMCITFSACACGARSGLEIEDASAPDAPVVADASDATDAPVPRDAGPVDASRDAGRDAGTWRDCAATDPQPGDLIMGSGPAVYYIATDGRRYVFPNENTYYSWYPDFSGVCRMSDARLASIPVGGNVTIRPGTFLVKIVSDPRVYAISPGGVLHWVESEDIAVALYGPTWARRVKDVPDAFFVNYAVGLSVNRRVHPDGQLVAYVGSSEIYLVEGGRRRRLLSGAFEANGFQRFDRRDPSIRFVIETTILYPDGEPIAGRLPRYAEAFCASCGR
jgi:hypothetical protein